MKMNMRIMFDVVPFSVLERGICLNLVSKIKGSLHLGHLDIWSQFRENLQVENNVV